MRASRPQFVLPAVAGALALSLACAGDPAAPSPGPDVAIVPGAVAQGSAGFDPNPLVRTAAEGARVTWLNRDYPAGSSSGTRHRLISDDGLFDSGEVAPGETFSYEFAQPGTYGYRCLNHPTMTGTVSITR